MNKMQDFIGDKFDHLFEGVPVDMSGVELLIHTGFMM